MLMRNDNVDTSYPCLALILGTAPVFLSKEGARLQCGYLHFMTWTK
jgi:hypothetical protein